MTEPRADRAFRARRRRQSIVAASIVVLAAVVLGGGALIASDALRLEGGPGPALAERVATTTTRERRVPQLCRRRLSPEDPLRLWIAGDSLAGSLGPSLGARTAATGIVQPVYDSRVSSGLSSPAFFDWPEHATAEMARLDPEVVVFIIGANDWKTPTDDPSWEDEYRLQVEEMLAIFEDGGDTRHVYWVGSPTMQERRKDQGVLQVNAIAREVVEQHDQATYVDAYELFSDDDEDGGYTASIPGPNDKDVRVRAGDGIHLTVEGGNLLGDHVFAQLEPRCDLDEQAVPDQAKDVLRTPGSDGPSGTTGGGSGSTRGTTPTTAPPVIEAPTPDVTATTATSQPPPEMPEPDPPAPPDPPEEQTES